MRFFVSMFALGLALTVIGPVSGQDPYAETFDTYGPGSGIIGQGGWEPWDGAAPDGFVSDIVSEGGSQSFQVQALTDVVQTFSPAYSGGAWTITAHVYIPSTMTGGEVYFILLNTYESGAAGPKDWSTQITFDNQGNIESLGGSNGAGEVGTTTGDLNTWHEIRVDVDLDANEQQVYIDGDPFVGGSWATLPGSGGAGALEIKTIDLFSNNADDGFFDSITIDPSVCAPITGLDCTPEGGNLDVDLTWTNGVDYGGGVDIARGGVTVATLAGDAESYTDTVPSEGAYDYTITGNCIGQTTVASCSVTLLPADTTDVVWSPPDTSGGAVDSAAAIFDELVLQGRTPYLVTSLSNLDLAPFAGVWAVLGTFNDNHVLTGDEGQALRDFAIAGGGLYVEGSDVWGFDAPTALDDVDHTEGLADGAVGGDLEDVVGLDSEVGLDLIGLGAPYSGENNYIDHLAADTAVASGAAAVNSGGALQNVSVAGDGFQSELGCCRTVTASYEFGGLDAAARSALMTSYLGFMGGEKCTTDCNACPVRIACFETEGRKTITYSSTNKTSTDSSFSIEGFFQDGSDYRVQKLPGRTTLINHADGVVFTSEDSRSCDGQCNVTVRLVGEYSSETQLSSDGNTNSGTIALNDGTKSVRFTSALIPGFIVYTIANRGTDTIWIDSWHPTVDNLVWTGGTVSGPLPQELLPGTVAMAPLASLPLGSVSEASMRIDEDGDHDDTDTDEFEAEVLAPLILPGGTSGGSFVRGDADADGLFNGIVDGLRVLGFQFVPGTPAPPCMEAADADGDGVFNGLQDGLFVLSATFIPGSPLPPEPFPRCGQDPDPDTSLGCDSFPACL